MSLKDDRKKRPKMEYTDGTHPDQSNDQNYIQRRVLRSGYLSIQSYIRGTFPCFILQKHLTSFNK